MDPNLVSIIIGVAALLVGIIAGKFIFAKNTQKIVEEAELQSKNVLKEAELRAETIRKEKELEVKEKFIQLKAAHDKEVNDRNRKINESVFEKNKNLRTGIAFIDYELLKRRWRQSTTPSGRRKPGY